MRGGRREREQGRVALGMSGGVDSSASAAVLLSEGWGVVGVTCVFQDDERSEAAVRDARAVCERLHIPHVVRDSTTTFEQCVVASLRRRLCVRYHAEPLRRLQCFLQNP